MFPAKMYLRLYCIDNRGVMVYKTLKFAMVLFILLVVMALIGV